ncbi:hypothetical protein NKH45_34800 [Mesorhizobium sp. M1156]|uniref:hypothetical protein n=1 Tax=unclassified Mesorhizobium TaxID=325217 RepID=UPI003337A8F9
MSSNYPRPRSRQFQTRVSNGKEILPGIDGRSKWARRLHDLIANHVADLGGPGHVTQSQYVLVKSAANIIIVMEQWELEFAREGTASLPALLAYQTIANSLRRIFETLGLSRVDPPRDVTPILDLSKLDPAEQQRFRTLCDKYNKFGMDGLLEDQARELHALMSKARQSR